MNDDMVRCHCRCHGVVVMDAGELKAYLNCPPRYDQSQAWAEACSKCETRHWLAATVHDEIEHLGSSGDENLNIYLVNQQRKHNA